MYSARAGWGYWVGPGSIYKKSRFLGGLTQSSYRAELRAMCHALKHVAAPTRIVTDCKGIANAVNDILQGTWIADARCPEADLWALVEHYANVLGPEQVVVQWMPSHLGEAGREKELAQARQRLEITDDMVHGNDQADRYAEEGRKMHLSIAPALREAGARMKGTVAAHRACLRIWSRHMQIVTAKCTDKAFRMCSLM